MYPFINRGVRDTMSRKESLYAAQLSVHKKLRDISFSFNVRMPSLVGKLTVQ